MINDNKLVDTKVSLEELSKSIDSKRCPELDSDSFELRKLQKSPYDIRTERDVGAMIETLKRDGQLERLTVTFNDNTTWIVNGRTRVDAFSKLNVNFVKIKAYINLTQLEQNYLNAIINSNQKTLTTTEKLRFVRQHADALDEKSLKEALGLESENHARTYVKVAKMLDEDPILEDYLKTSKAGRGRGDIEIETARIVAKVKDKTARRKLAKYARDTAEDDRIRRTSLIKRAKVANELVSIKDELNLTTSQIMDTLSERTTESLFSLFKISKGSEGKYAAYANWVEVNAPNTVICFDPTTPTLLGSPTKKSEAMMTVEAAQLRDFKVVLVERDKPIANIWRRQCRGLKNVDIINKSAEEYLVENLYPSTEKTLLYFNFKGDKEARQFLTPEFIKSIKRLRPDSSIGHIIVEEWCNPTSKVSNYLELSSWFGVDNVLKIKKLEDFLNYHNQLLKPFNITWNIEWQKTLEEGNKRRVALVTFT